MKAPLGLLIRGSFDHTMGKLKAIVDKRRPRKLISVGDRVSRNIIERKMPLDVLIVDNKVMRRDIVPLAVQVDKIVKANNPAGTITDEARQAIAEAVNYGGRTEVLVEGEEDLLTLVAVTSAPDDSLVVYGQPREGIVVIIVTPEAKKRVNEIINRMERTNSKS